MYDVAIPTPPAEGDVCTRCLQPVPWKARRCAGCGHPHHNRRYLPVLIGAAGLLVLAFVMALMYFSARNVDLQNAPAQVDGDAPQDIMVKTPPDNGKPAEPAKPEKRPPLNEK